MAKNMQARAKKQDPPADASNPGLRGPDSREEQVKIKACYRKHTANQANADGKVKLHLVITPEGKVHSIGVEAPSVEGTEFRDCVAALAKKWRFRQAVIETKVVYPLYFVAPPSRGTRGMGSH